jgi:4-hydroxy-tetrahydrodipicolinate synthase
MIDLGNLMTAMVTPFKDDLSVDYDRAAQLAEKLYAEGTDTVLVAGTTGESPTLTKDEKLRLFRVVKEAAGDRPVMAGTGCSDTAASIALTKAAAETGVDCILLVGPYYSKPSQEGMYQHFKAIAQATDLPITLYNIPGRTGKNIETPIILRLAEELPNIHSVKEASGDIKQISEICARKPESFTVYSGDDGLTLPVLALGGRGVISVVAHVAGRIMADLCAAFHAGDIVTARRLHHKVTPMIDACFLASGNPACVKRALEFAGFPCGGTRLPVVPASEADTKTIRTAWEGLNQ